MLVEKILITWLACILLPQMLSCHVAADLSTHSSMVVCSCPRAATTKCHQLSGLNDRNVLSHSSGG